MARSTSKLLEKKSEEMVNTEETVINTPVTNDEVQDIVIEGAKRKKFRINGDNNKILELNTNDMGVSYRLTEAYKRLNELMSSVQETLKDLPDDGELDEEGYDKVVSGLKELNDGMCREIDFIFDAPVAEMCADGGSMYDPSNGMFRYEHIIDKITSLYETSLNHEFTLMRQRANNRASKYTVKTPKKATKKYNH